MSLYEHHTEVENLTHPNRIFVSFPGQSQLIAPSQQIVATIGDDVILPCHVKPEADVVAMTLEWTRSDLNDIIVHVRRASQDVVRIQHPSYKGRTSVSIYELKHGNVSLKLSEVKPSDAGRYQCYIPKLDTGSVIELIVGEWTCNNHILWTYNESQSTNTYQLNQSVSSLVPSKARSTCTSHSTAWHVTMVWPACGSDKLLNWLHDVLYLVFMQVCESASLFYSIYKLNCRYMNLSIVSQSKEKYQSLPILSPSKESKVTLMSIDSETRTSVNALHTQCSSQPCARVVVTFVLHQVLLPHWSSVYQRLTETKEQ